MKEDEIKVNVPYNFQIQFFTLSLMLKQERYQVVYLQLFNKEGGQSFDLAIDKNNIEQNMILSFLYESPRQLFVDMLSNIAKLKVHSDGVIVFCIDFQGKSKEIKFKAQEKKLTIEQIQIKLLNKMKVQHEIKIKDLQKHVQILRQQAKEVVKLQIYQLSNEMILVELQKIKNNAEVMSKQIISLKNENKHQKIQLEIEKRTLIQAQNRLQKSLKAHKQQFLCELKQLKEQNEKLMETIKLNEQRKNIENQKIQRQNERILLKKQSAKIQELKEIKENKKPETIIDKKQFSQAIEIFKVENHRRYQIERLQNKLRIKYKWHGVWHGCIRPYVIPVGKITKIHYKQVNKIQKSVFYGITTDKTNGLQNPYSHLQCKTYYTGEGFLYQNAKNRKIGVPLNKGGIITVIADLISWKIKWVIKNVQIACADISIGMRANKLFFIIIMHDKNSQVQLLGSE